MSGGTKITFRVSDAENDEAEKLARGRGYVTVSKRANVSRLMRALLAEEIEREKERIAAAKRSKKKRTE